MAFFWRKPTQGSFWGPKYTSCILYLVSLVSCKLAAGALIKPINYIINQSLESGIFPSKWKIAQLIPLFKGKGTCPFNPPNYLPILILSVVSKLTERAVQHQLIDFMDRTHQLNRNHHAYWKHHSTVTAMIQMTDRIFTATDSNHITTLLTIDKSAAFDCVPHDQLIKKMSLYNFSNDIKMVHKLFIWSQSICDSKFQELSHVLSVVWCPSGLGAGPINVHIVH